MPKYENKGGQPREKCMVAAYALVTQFGAKQSAVAQVMGCKQPTISNWVKEVGFRKEISGLKKDLSKADDYVKHLAKELKLTQF